VNLFAYLVVLSNFQELKDLSKLQSSAKEKQLASINVSRSILHDSALSTISNKYLTSSNDHLRNHSITSTASIASTVSESFDRVYKDQENQRILQEQQLQQLKLTQAYNLLKNSQVPLQNPSLL
jgi:hypothetical protein